MRAPHSGDDGEVVVVVLLLTVAAAAAAAAARRQGVVRGRQRPVTGIVRAMIDREKANGTKAEDQLGQISRLKHDVR